jgi:hypothetical protein
MPYRPTQRWFSRYQHFGLAALVRKSWADSGHHRDPVQARIMSRRLSTALPNVEAEHEGFNENETHVPLLVVHSSLTPGQNRAPVTTTQIAPTILSLLNINPSALMAVQLEGTSVLPGTGRNNNGNGNSSGGTKGR